MVIDRLAIILVNYRDYADRYLAECWASLQKQNWSGQWRAYIVDNASTAASRATIAGLAPGASIIINEHNDGFAKGNNDGLKQAWADGYDYAWLLNLDTVVAPDALRELTTAAATAPADWGAIQARLMLHPDTTRVNSLGNALHYLGFGYSAGGGQVVNQATAPVEPIRGYGSGAALLVRRDRLEPLGGFDEVFWMYHDDLELGWRLVLAGFPTYLAHRAVVYHKYEFAKSIKQYYWMERNRWIWYLTAYRWPTVILLAPMMVAMELGLWFFALRGGFASQKLRAVAWVFDPRHWSYLRSRRHRIAQRRVISDRAASSLLASVIQFQAIDNWLLRRVANPMMTIYWRVARAIIFW